MNNKNKIIIKSSLKLGRFNKEVDNTFIKKEPPLKKILKHNITGTFNADYVLNVDLGLLENFVNFNQFFNIATYDQNNIVQLEINREFINNVLFNPSGFIKFDSIDANPDVVNNPIYSKLNTNKTNLNYRFLEILSTKIFGDPTLKNLILNQETLIEVTEGINSVLTDVTTTADILNTYSQLPVYVVPTDVTNFNFRNTIWDFPMYLNGHVLDTLGVESNTFNGPNMGGSVITDGIYNIPIILRFYGVSSRKIVIGGRGKRPNNILAYSYDAFDWINATLPELNKDYFRQINACLYIPNLWLAGGLPFNDGSNNIMTSTDGITWNYKENENIVSNVMSLATNDTISVARYIIGALNTNGSIDSPNTVLYSYNNKDWFESSSGSELFSLGLLNVKYNGSLWVGVGISTTGGIIGYSLDGTEWIKSTSGSNKLDMYAYDVVWNGLIWVALGRGNSSIIYSSDGINWSISTSGTNLLNPCSAITWDGINFIAGGDSIIYSSNGIDWTASNATLFSSINNISSNSTIAIASGTIINDLEHAQLAYSLDHGLTWAESINTLSNEQAITSTCWNGTYWLGSVISNNDGCVIIYSDDGITWEDTNTDIFSTNGFCSNLSWDGLQWTAVGCGYDGVNFTDTLVATSKDGYNWTISTASTLIVSGRCTSYANILPKIIKRETSDLIVASGSGNFDLMVGIDGLYWYGINLFFQTNSVIWIGNKWICGGPEGFGYSNDGINWLPNNTIPFISGTVNILSWNGFMVIAGTTNGDYSIVYSYDGITWFPSFQINSILEPSYGIYSLTWGNNKWVAGTINPRKQILSVIDPNSYDFNFGNDCTKTIDDDFTTSWDPVTGYNLYQLVFTFDNNTKINCINCFCSAVDDTEHLITGIQIEYLDSNSNYQSLINTTLSLSDFTIKESLHLYEANFDLVLTNSIRISFQKSTPNQVFITEVQFFEIIDSILYSADGINWNPVNSSKGRFKELVNSIIWDGNEIVATSNSLNEDNESILNYSTDLVNWTAPSSVSDIFIANTSLSTDYSNFYNLINREVFVPINFNVYITDLNKQVISYTFNNSIDYYSVQYLDSDDFTLLEDLSSNSVTIESTINLVNEHSYLGILTGIKNNYINSIYFKFWAFNYTNLTVVPFDISPNYGYTFSFYVGNLGFDNQINKSIGIGIIDSNNSLIHTFPLTPSNNYYFETTIDFLYSELAVYLTDNTTYSFCIIGEYYQPDFDTLYTIRTTYNSTFLFTSPNSIIPITNLITTFITSTKINVSFTPPNNISNVINYTLTLSPSNVTFTIDKNDNSIILTSLIPETIYNISIVTNYIESPSPAVSINVKTLSNVSNQLYFTPLSIPNLSCWYDASDSTSVINGSWKDKSLNNNTLNINTQQSIATPTYANNAVTFPNGAVMSTSNSFNLTTSSFLIAVVNLTELQSTTLSTCIDFGSTTVRFQNIDSSNYNISCQNGGDFSLPNYHINGNISSNEILLPIPIGSPFMFNGFSRTSLTSNLFLSGNTYGRFFTGNYHEILLYDSVTPAQRLQLEGYLAWKWNLQSSLPNNHPYKNVSPNYIPDATQTHTTIINNEFIPTDISGSQVWLDASDTSTLLDNTDQVNINSIHKWLDKSPNNNNFNTQENIPSSTTYNGLNVVIFNNTILKSILPATYPADMYIVLKLNDTTTHRDILGISHQSSDDFDALVFSEYSGSRWHNGSSGFGKTPNAVANEIETSTDYLLIQWSIADNNFLIRRFGNTISQTSSYSWHTLDGNFFYYLGTRTNYNTGANFSGAIAEMLIYDRQLQIDEQQKLEGYLAWKWGIQTNLSPSHPYYNSSPSSSSSQIIYKFPLNAFVPSNLPNLGLWLDGKDSSTITLSGSTVTQWDDKSGQNNNATGVGNLTTSNNTILFDGSTTYFTTPYTSFSSNETAFIVFNSNSSTQQGLIDTNSATGRAYQILPQGPSIANSAIVWLIISSIVSSQNITYIGEYNYNNNGMNLLLNGIPAGSNNTNPNFGAGITTIGAGYNGPMWFFSGAISEIIIYNSVLSKEDSQKVEGYLAWKWGLQNNLPKTHPFYYAPPLQYSLLTPYEIPNVKMWLDAADMATVQQDISNNITQINDKSENGNNGSQSNIANSPKYSVVNGLGMMSFNGTSSSLSTQDLYSNQSFSIFLLVQRTTSNNSLILGGSNFNSNNSLSLDIGNTSIGFHFYNNDINGIFPTSFSNTNESFNLLEFSFTPGNRQIFVNGTLIISDTNTSFLTNCDGMNFCYYASNYSQINIGEVIVLNGVPDILTRIKLEGYFNWKWGINTSLPNGHSYISKPPPLLNLQTNYTPDLEGNLTCWFDATDPYNEQLIVDDGTPLTCWVNKVDNSIATVISKPAKIKNFIQNNLSVIRFTGQQSYLINYPNFPNTAYTIFIVVYTNDNSTYKRILSKDLILFVGSLFGTVANFTGGVTWNDTSPNTPSTNIYQQFSIISITVSSNILNTFINGLQLDSKNGTTGSLSNLNIGGDSGQNWVGDIGEILIYSTDLSDSKRQRVEGYLAWKWGINNNLISTQTYKYLPPTTQPIFNPLNIPGIKMWFDSSDLNIGNNEVLTWTNKADNSLATGTSGSTGLGNQIVINNIPVVHFPTNNFMTTSNITFTKPYRNIFGVFNIYESGINYNLLGCLNNNGNQLSISQSNGDILEFDLCGITVIMRINLPNNSFNSINVFSGTINNINHNISINSIAQSLITDNTTTLFPPLITNQFIGAYSGNKLDLAELILIDSDLSQTQQDEINAYLAWKWGLVDKLPSNNNYRLKPPSNFKSVFEPSSISSLSLWLDGSDPNGDGTFLTDGSSINTWFDKSGYNRNAIAQSFPNSTVAIIKNNIVNSLPIIRCNGTQRYFVNYQSFPNTNYTIFTVQLCNADNVRGYQRLISGSDHDYSLFVGVKGTTIGTFTSRANESWNDINENSPPIDNMGSWKIVSTVVNNSVLTPYVNGTAQNTKVGTTQSFNHLYIGGANLGMDDIQYWNGDIADIMIFNETLSQNNREKIEGYLAWKWGLQSGLPNNHPYKNEFNTIIGSNLRILNSHDSSPPVILLKAINYSGSGDWNDESGNGKNANLLVGNIAKNNSGNGIILDGSTAWTFPNLNLGNAWTIEAWYKDSNISQGQACIVTQGYQSGQNINAFLGFIQNIQIQGGFYNSSDSFHTSPLVTLDLTMSHYAVTWDGSNLLFYKNKILQNTTTISATSNDSGEPYYIGKQWGYDIFMIGEIGEVRIYNYALTQTQINADYDESYPTFSNINNNLLVLLKAINYSGSGSWNDESGNDNNATLERGTIAKNSDGNGIVLDGSTGWTFPNISISNNWTINLWYKNNGVMPMWSNILTQNTGVNPLIAIGNIDSNDGKIRIGTYENKMFTPFSITQGEWTNIQVTWDGTTAKLYINSVLTETNASSGFVLNDNGNAYRIGWCWNNTPAFVTGEIGEVRIYNYPLTQSQITTDYNESLSTYINIGPKIFLKAINYSGSGTWNDETGNNNNATIENGTIAKNTDGNGIILNGSTSWTFPNVAVGNAWTANVWFKQTGSPIGTYAAILTQMYLYPSNATVNFVIGYPFYNNTQINTSFLAPGNSWYYGTDYTITNNVWTNIQATWDGTNLATYINGVLIGTTQPGNIPVDSGLGYRIGRRWDTTDYVVGEIGEVRIYNYALSESQVMTDYLSSYNDFAINIDINSLPFVKLYINSKDTDNIILEGNQIVSITNKTNTLDASTLPPPIYSNSSIHFYQPNCYLTLDNSIINNATSYCMFFVFKIDSTNSTMIFNKQHNGQSSLYINIVGGIINFHFDDNNTNWDAQSNINLSINTIYILTIIWNGTNLVFRINGTLDSSNIGGNFNIPDDLSPTFTSIGSSLGDMNTFSDWNLYDFIYCDSLISLENINILEGFLAWKWNLQVNLPFNHEYKNRKPLNTDILPFKPTSLSNLSLWLDAGDITTIDLSDNVIIHWYDKSGLGNNGIPINNPIYDASSNSVSFDGSSYFYLPSGSIPYGDSSYSIYFVAKWTTTNTSAVIGAGSTGGNTAIGIRSEGGNTIRSYWWGNDMTDTVDTFNTVLHDFIYESGSNRSTYLYGTNTGTDTPGTRVQPDTGNTIGKDVDDAYMIGTISEIIVYSTNHSAIERQKVEGYLAWKWGLVSSLPSDHPYKNVSINTLTPNEFSPYSSGSVTTWLDGSDLSNMFNDITLNTVITTDNQKIVLWKDKSPNAYYFKQNNNSLEPSISLNSLTNLPSVVFNNQILESYPMSFFTSANSGGTFFFVFDSNSSSATTLLGYQNQTSGIYNDTETFIGYSFDNRTNRFGFSRDGGMSTNTNNMTIDMSFNLISSVLSSSGGSPSNILIYKNGNDENIGNIGSGYYSAGSYPYENNSVLMTIGGAHVRGGNENLFQNGNIAEIIWFNYPLSLSERQKIEGYLAWKWGLQSNLPSSHPFYNGSPTLQLKYIDFSPLAINGLNLWLDAKDLWKDKSGKGLIVTPHGSPNLTEDKLISFNGTDQYFSIPYSGDHSIETGFVIIKFNNTSGEQDIICGDNGGRQYHNYNGDIRIASAGVTGGITNPAAPPAVSTLALLEYTITPTTINLYQNGTLLSTSPVSVTMGTESYINIGVNFALSSNTYFNGFIGEVILFDSILSDIDRNKVEGYLAWKWGIQTSLPNDHPYINFKTPPQLLPLPDQNVNLSITISDDTPHLNDNVTFTAVTSGIYKFVSSTWTVNSNIVSKNRGSFSTVLDQVINYTIEYTLVTVNNTYTSSYSISLLPNLPSQLPNLTVWLDGTDVTKMTLDSSGNITQWTDKSTNSYQFTGSNPGPNRTNLSAHFYGQDNYFSYNPTIFNNANTYTFMMVAEFGNLTQYLMCKQHDGFNSEIVLGLGQPGLNQSPATPGILYWNTYTQGSFANSTTPLEINTKYIIIITYDGNNLIFRINGQIYSTTSGDFKIIDDLSANYPFLGNWSYFNTNNDWKLYDFIYTNSETSSIEIIKMEGYFASKWNLKSSLPSDHPYKSTVPESISFNTFSPNSFSGLNLWLDASETSSITLNGNNVTMWTDRRNNGINATPGISPTYNSTNKSIQFDGSQTQYLNLSDGTIPYGDSGYSMFIVISTTDPIPPQWYLTGGSGQVLGSAILNNSISNSWASGNTELWTSAPITANQPLIVELFYDQTTRSNYFNGTFAGSDVPGVRNNDIYNNMIGYSSHFGQPLTGNIYEIIIYNKQLTNDEKVQIEGYLAWKWNLQSYLPNNHNFKNVSPNDLDLNVTTSLSADNENPILGDTVNLTATKSGYYPLVSENWILNRNIVASNTLSYSQTYSAEGAYLLSYNLNTVNNSYSNKFNKILGNVYNPNNINGLVLWLDAKDVNNGGAQPNDEQAVITWYDKSGFNSNASQTQNIPLFNTTEQGISFSGVGNGYQLPDGAFPYGDSSYTYFFVFKTQDFSSNYQLLKAGLGNDGQTYIYDLYIYTTTDRKVTIMSYNDVGPDTNSSINLNKINISSMGYDNITHTRNLNLNFDTPVTKGGGVRNLISINNYIGGGFNTFKGFMYEVLAFNRALSNDEKDLVNGYLAWKWNTINYLPLTNPYYNDIPLLWKPTIISGLQVWLDASSPNNFTLSGSNIIMWNDKSGNSNNATSVNNPQLVNKSVVFDGVSNYFTLPYTTTPTAETVFIVTTFANNNITLIDTTNSGGRQIWIDGNNILNLLSADTSTILQGITTLTQNTPTIIEYTFNQTDVVLYETGIMDISGTGSYNFSGSGTMKIGQSYHQDRYIDGTINEVLIYDSVLTPTQRQVVEGYLAWKWNLTSSIPTNHPFKLYAPNSATSLLPFTPNLLSGLTLWFDGLDASTIIMSGSNVTQWNDKSDLSNNTIGVTGTPTFTAGLGVVFDSSTYFNLPDGSIPYDDSSYSIYVVTKFNTISNYAGFIGGGANNNGQCLCIRVQANGPINTYWYWNDLATNTSVTPESTFLFGSLYQSGAQRTIFLFGSPSGSDTPGTRYQPNTNNFLGKTTDGLPMDGFISEILVYNTNHTTLERQTVEGYLAWKWGLQSQLPIDHPFYNRPPS